MKTKNLVFGVVNISNEDNADRAYDMSAEVHVYPDNTVKAIHNGVVMAVPTAAVSEEPEPTKGNKLAAFSDINGVSLDRAGITDAEYMPVMMAVYQFCQDIRQMVANGEVMIVVHNPNA